MKISKSTILAYDKTYKDGYDKKYPSIELVRIEKIFFRKKGLVLDYGCGPGSNGIHLLLSGYNVVFCDISKLALKKLKVNLKRSTYVQFYGMQLKDATKKILDEKSTENGVVVVVNRNGTLYRMGVRAGYILTEINETPINSTSELSSFENENIYQITFIDLNGEKERLIFD